MPVRSEHRPAVVARPSRHFPDRAIAGAPASSVSRLACPAARGFTLLEVLVALAVLALALGALVAAGGRQAAAVEHLRDRTLAEWVAQDQLAELRLQTSWPDPGMRRGATRMGRAEWHWTLEVSATEDPDLRRIDVEVRSDAADPDPVVTLSGFAGRY